MMLWVKDKFIGWCKEVWFGLTCMHLRIYIWWWPLHLLAVKSVFGTMTPTHIFMLSNKAEASISSIWGTREMVPEANSDT